MRFSGKCFGIIISNVGFDSVDGRCSTDSVNAYGTQRGFEKEIDEMCKVHGYKITNVKTVSGVEIVRLEKNLI